MSSFINSLRPLGDGGPAEEESIPDPNIPALCNLEDASPGSVFDNETQVMAGLFDDAVNPDGPDCPDATGEATPVMDHNPPKEEIVDTVLE